MSISSSRGSVFDEHTHLNTDHSAARSFFDIYDHNRYTVRETAAKVGVSFDDAWAWVYIIRPRAEAIGNPWPYYDEEDDADEFETELFSEPVDEEDSAVDKDAVEAETVVLQASTDEHNLSARLTALNMKTLEDAEPVESVPGKAYYHAEHDAYLVYLTNKNKLLKVPRQTHNEIKRAYSNYDGNPVKTEDIARRVGITRTELMKYKRAFGWTRASIPLTEKEMASMSAEEAAKQVASLREAAVADKIADRFSKEDKRDARKWRELKTAVLDEFKEVILNLPALQAVDATVERLPESDASYSLICPFNDWQIGSYADGGKLRFGRQYDAYVVQRMIDDYRFQFKRYLSRNAGAQWGLPWVTLLGDILHGIMGETVHGTKLSKTMREFDWKQIKLALKHLTHITDTIVKTFGGIRLIVLPGNHEGYVGHLFGEVLAERYQNYDVELIEHRARTHFAMIGNSLFVFDHGASPDSSVTGGRIARNGARRDVQIKDLVYSRADLVDKARRSRGGVYFVMGDQHHTIDESMASVELIKLGALPSGDHYSDENGWHSRPMQGVLLVDHSCGLAHFERFYFDNKRVFPDERLAIQNDSQHLV